VKIFIRKLLLSAGEYHNLLYNSISTDVHVLNNDLLAELTQGSSNEHLGEKSVCRSLLKLVVTLQNPNTASVIKCSQH